MTNTDFWKPINLSSHVDDTTVSSQFRNLGEVVIYELNAWSGYMLPRVLPNAIRVTAEPLEPLDDILARVPPQTWLFAFHLNLTNARCVPLCRDALCNSLAQRGIRLLNSAVVDIGKRSLQATCRELNLNCVGTSRFLGGADDLVIVKTDQNHAGAPERKLTSRQREILGVSSSQTLTAASDYLVLSRRNVPLPWWNDHTLAIEEYKCNAEGIKYRCYFAGECYIVVKTRSKDVVMRLDTNQITNVYSVSRESVNSISVPNLPMDLQNCLTSLIDHLQLDFGAIDFVQDDSGRTFIVDVNTTSFSRALTEQSIGYLRDGLIRHTLGSKHHP